MKIDLGKCVHCGTCFAVYPQWIEEKDGKYYVKSGIELSEQDKKDLVAVCPVGAIGE